jgi:iron-sulfur cluster assembly protein
LETNRIITITPPALDVLKKRLEGRSDCDGIRLRVDTAGCSGYAYGMEYSYAQSCEDITVTVEDVTLIIDPKSVPFLTGTRLEYLVEGLNEGFQFVNPNVTGECGCGESFYVEK